ncbi:hypothetical protein [uncultured Ruegeria sp.]|uniref:hypothetical protein n=1 Tax=uncultured Ruegeria sp. TaxID=259304 RepID=UPI002622611A|nr:hypothetical protein [uncultured Ruegeria sp.]
MALEIERFQLNGFSRHGKSAFQRFISRQGIRPPPTIPVDMSPCGFNICAREIGIDFDGLGAKFFRLGIALSFKGKPLFLRAFAQFVGPKTFCWVMFQTAVFSQINIGRKKRCDRPGDLVCTEKISCKSLL